MGQANWKDEYIKWYRIVEREFGNLVPHLEDHEIKEYVSKAYWLMIPTPEEKDRQEAILRPQPNIYFSLGDDDITVGLTCNTLDSVRKVRNILLPFHSQERLELEVVMEALDDQFKTTVSKKIKEFYPFQTPDYQGVYEFQANQINETRIGEIFKKVDQIEEERKKHYPKQLYKLAPVVEIARIVIPVKESEFAKVLRQLHPIYEILVKVRTTEEIASETERRQQAERKVRQQRFADFVQFLKSKGIRGEEYRRRVEHWNREHQ